MKVERRAGNHDLPVLQVTLWVVCALMAISAVAFAFMTFAKPMADRTQGCEALIPHKCHTSVSMSVCDERLQELLCHIA